MPTELPDNTFIQTIITAFTEHPEALQILLQNKPMNDALAAYLNAAAERLKPESKLKEIYRLRGNNKRLYRFEDGLVRPGLPDNTAEVVSGLWLFYDSKMKAAALYGGTTEAEQNWMRYEGFIPRVELVKWIEFFDEESDAIHWAQKMTPMIEEAFVKNTEPIPKTAQDSDHADA